MRWTHIVASLWECARATRRGRPGHCSCRHADNPREKTQLRLVQVFECLEQWWILLQKAAFLPDLCLRYRERCKSRHPVSVTWRFFHCDTLNFATRMSPSLFLIKSMPAMPPARRIASTLLATSASVSLDARQFSINGTALPMRPRVRTPLCV